MSRRLHAITLFPEMFGGFLSSGVVGRAFRERGFEMRLVNPQDHSPRGRKGVDDAPYGGGQGMVMRADVLRDALADGVLAPLGLARGDVHVVLPDAGGARLDNRRAARFARERIEGSPKDVVLVCGRYRGVDERFAARHVDETVSVGDYVLTGGELAAMVLVDSVLRFVPGVLGNGASSREDSFEDGLLAGPLYTRPPVFEGLPVPGALLGGDHRLIGEHRARARARATRERRPDLLPGGGGGGAA